MITLAQLKSRLESIESLKNKVAYNHFAKIQEPPYVIFYRGATDDVGADLKPAILKNQEIVIELYTENINSQLENEIENVFSNFELSKDEMYIESENLYLIRYSFNQLLK